MNHVTDRHVVVDHVLFVVADFAASRRLYTAALAPLGMEEMNPSPIASPTAGTTSTTSRSVQGEPVTTAAHVAFDADDRDQVDAFYDRRRARRGRERPRTSPALDPPITPSAYIRAFVNDLHGNNVEAVFHSDRCRWSCAAAAQDDAVGSKDGWDRDLARRRPAGRSRRASTRISAGTPS